MLIALILAALLATDIAVAVLYFSTRPGRAARARTPSATASEAATREIEDLVVTLRRQAEQATAEIGRQKAQLRRLLAGMGEAEPPATSLAAHPSAVRSARLPSLSDDDLAETLPLSRLLTSEQAASAALATPGQIRRLARAAEAA